MIEGNALSTPIWLASKWRRLDQSRRWLCVGDRAFLCLQLNDRTCARESISLVLRSYVIEQLIRRGIRELVFWKGTSAPLSFYTTPREEFMVYVDSRRIPGVSSG